MGCGDSKPPRADVPAKGEPARFVIKADSVFNSNNFTIYDHDQTKWLHWEGYNFDDKGGEAALFSCAKEAGEKPIVKFEISGVTFEESKAKHKDDEGWFSEGDVKTKLKWTIRRKVTVFTSASGREGDADTVDGQVCGELEVVFEGVAEAKKDVEYEKDGREVKWKKEARTQEVTYKMKIEGEDVPVTASPGSKNVSFWGGNGWQWKQSYQCGPFQVNYVDKTGCDEVTVETQGKMNPPVALCLGFALAYWMHPKRVEDDAANKAMEMVQKRSGWF